MKIVRKIIEINEERRDGCDNCVTVCDEGAIQIVNGKAKENIFRLSPFFFFACPPFYSN
jgi:ferredoxin